MNVSLNRLRMDIDRMLKTLRFHAGDGARAQGEFVDLMLMPMRQAGSPLCQLVLRMDPVRPGNALAPGSVAGVREASERGATTSQPALRGAAEAALRVMDSPGLPPAALEALEIDLRQVSDTPPLMIRTARTDRHGRATFPNVPVDTDCYLALRSHDEDPLLLDAVAGLKLSTSGAVTYRNERWEVTSTPHFGAGSLADVLVTLKPRDSGAIVHPGLRLAARGEGALWLADDLADPEGRIRFSQLPPGDYAALLDLTETAASTDEVAGFAAVPMEGTDAPLPPLVIRPADKRLLVMIEEDSYDQSLVTVEMEFRYDTPPVVLFQMGDESLRLTLERYGDRWRAVAHLAARFSTLRGTKTVPVVELIQPLEPEPPPAS